MGRPERARATLHSVAAQSFFPEKWEILLVGKAASKVAMSYPALPITPVALKQNELPSRTRLEGSLQASGKWFIFVDDDVELADDFFANLHTLLQKEDNNPQDITLGAIGARLPGVKNNFFDHLVNNSNFWSQQGKRPGPRTWLYSAAIAIRAEAYSKVGGFNPRLPNGEDIDLTQRIVMAGYRLQYKPALVARHNHGRTTLAGMLKYIWKNGNTAEHFNQHCHSTRCFSIKTIVVHAWRDLQSNRKLNASQIENFHVYLPFIFFTYLLFQCSMEWHYQKFLRSENRYRDMPLRENGDRETLNAFDAFLKRQPLRGAFFYTRALLEDLYHPVRR